jgi:hypothetical protein
MDFGLKVSFLGVGIDRNSRKRLNIYLKGSD